MPTPNENKDEKKETPPAPSSGEKGTTPPAAPVGVSEAEEEAEFEKQLKDLEEGTQTVPVTPASKSKEDELKQATYTAKSVIKRIKDLGGDPAAVLADAEVATPAAAPVAPTETSQFVTRAELAQAEVSRIAKTPSEAKVIMWWIRNKGMSIADAHYMANKGRNTKLIGEVRRSTDATPAAPGAGAGQPSKEVIDAPELSEREKLQVTTAGMKWDDKKKAYVGKKVQLRFDEASKSWVNERITA
jgi:hypothetical protein